MPNNQTTTDHAYARLRDLEGTRQGFHFDGMTARMVEVWP